MEYNIIEDYDIRYYPEFENDSDNELFRKWLFLTYKMRSLGNHPIVFDRCIKEIFKERSESYYKYITKE